MDIVSIKKIIDVSSILPAVVPGRRNFAYPLFVQKGDGFTETVKSYSSSAAVLEDLGSNSEAYKASLKYFAGAINFTKPGQFYVGLVNNSGLTSSTQGFFTSGDASANLAAFQAIPDGEFAISKDGSTALDVTTIDFTATTSLIEVAEVLQERIRLASELYRNITVSFDGTNFIFTSETYGSTSNFAITAVSGGSGADLTGATYLDGGSSTVGTTGTLASIVTAFLSDNRYYHIILSNDWNDAEILEWSSSVQASVDITYLLWALSTDANIADQDFATDISTIAKTLFDRKAGKTILCFDDTNTDYKQASFPSYFGGVNFTAARKLGGLANKQFASISPTSISNTRFDNLVSKNVNFYTVFGEAGRAMARQGKTMDGQSIKAVITADWVDYQMTYNIFDLLVTLPSVGYTQQEFAKLEQVIENAYLSAVSAGMIAGGTDPETGEVYLNGYKITMPVPSKISTADKTAGIINDIITIGLIPGEAVKFVITNTLKL